MDRCLFFNDTATTEIYTLSLHDALPISDGGDVEEETEVRGEAHAARVGEPLRVEDHGVHRRPDLLQRARDGRYLPEGEQPRHVRERELRLRSEEHTSELQSRQYLVCRLLLEKKKNRMPYSSCNN